VLALLIVAAILGGIVAAISGIGFLFWVVSIFIFICGLPFALINGFIQSKIDYVQDREDERMYMRELAEDARMDRYLDKLDELDDDEPDIYIDNRQVHYHNYYKEKEKEVRNRIGKK
jgi:flagellar motor component MotA